MYKTALTFHPAMAEGLIGAGVGAAGGYGYAQYKHKDKAKSMMVGALGGAGLGLGLGYAGRVGLTHAQGNIANNENTIRQEAQAFTDEMRSRVKPNTFAEDKVYDEAFKHKQETRDNLKNYASGGRMKDLYKRWAKDSVKDTRNIYRGNHTYGGESLYAKDMAESMANQQKIDSFHSQWTNRQAPGIDAAKYDGKVFGGLRGYMQNGGVRTQQARDLGTMRGQMNKMKSDADMSEYINNMFSGFGGHRGPSISTEEEVEAVMKSDAFRQRYRKTVGGAFRDARKNQKGEYFNQQFKQQEQAKAKTFNSVNINDHADVLGFDPTKIKTKKEMNKHLKNVYRQNHPDLAANEEERAARNARMPNINAAASAVKGSDWYEKLASFQQAYGDFS